jgi:hypothetical protein
MSVAPTRPTDWYIQIDEFAYGPFSVREMQELASSGTLQRTSLVWRQGIDSWIAASKVTGLFKNTDALTFRAGIGIGDFIVGRAGSKPSPESSFSRKYFASRCSTKQLERLRAKLELKASTPISIAYEYRLIGILVECAVVCGNRLLVAKSNPAQLVNVDLRTATVSTTWTKLQVISEGTAAIDLTLGPKAFFEWLMPLVKGCIPNRDAGYPPITTSTAVGGIEQHSHRTSHPRVPSPSVHRPEPEAAPKEANIGSSELIDLNKADEATFAALPGIGPILAKKAINIRGRRAFTSFEDFSSELGLKPHIVERLRSLTFVAEDTTLAKPLKGRVIDF